MLSFLKKFSDYVEHITIINPSPQYTHYDLYPFVQFAKCDGQNSWRSFKVLHGLQGNRILRKKSWNQ